MEWKLKMTAQYETSLCHATIRVRESTPCASRVVSEAVSDYVPEIKLIHSDSMESGWRRTITKIPAIISEDDLAGFSDHSEIIEDTDIRIVGNESWIILSLKDAALNEAMMMRSVFQKVTDHIATPRYEDFHLIMYPPTAVDSVVKSLSSFGDAHLLGREMVSFAKMPSFKFDITQSQALTEAERRIIQEAITRGWFDYPRPPEGHLQEMAPALGMAQSTLSIQLRQINRKLSTDYVRRFLTPI